MTQDELLAAIEKHSSYAWGNAGGALRAVVELHKPFLYPEDDKVYCYNCAESYPCPTIQAIEKELQ